MERNNATSFDIIFEELERLAEEEPPALSGAESMDSTELEEIRTLRDIVSQTIAPPDLYFSRT